MTAPARPRAQLPLRRRLLFLSIIALGLLLLFEVMARVAFFVAEGFNPYYLTYGFAPDYEWNANHVDGYSKFFPNSTRHQTVGKEIVDVKINGSGFRSAYDFVVPKPATTLRVAALGASSTFGYENRDDETYPVQLERMLAERYPGRRIEVLNLGLPQARLSNILALARTELAGFDPDLVLFYEGFNNAVMPRAREDASLPYRAKDALRVRSVAFRAMLPLGKVAYHKVSRALNRDVMGAHGLDVPIVLDSARVLQLQDTVASEFASNLDSLAGLVSRLGVPMILVTQPITLQMGQADSIPWRSYAQEVAASREAYAREHRLPTWPTVMLVHGVLQDSVRAIAARRGLPLVEGIAALDEDRRSNFASAVHLTPGGNRKLATAIARAIDSSGALGPALMAASGAAP